MEIAVIAIPFFIYMSFWIVFGDHESAMDKDRKKYFEGITLSLTSSYLECFEYFNKVVNNYPKSALAHFYLGKCHAYFGNYPAAIKSFAQSLVYDNTLPETYYEKGLAHYYLKEWEMALFELNRANWHFHNKNADVLRLKAEIEILQGDLETARKSLLLAINLGDEDANFLYLQNNFNEFASS